ncbi:Putative ribonuclease H protein At1g65750 [Linum perenne]
MRFSDRRAAVGGCLRDVNGKLIDGFAVNLGSWSITRVELSGVVISSERAWDAGIQNVEVQTDSAFVIKLFSEDVPCNNQHATIVGRFKRIARTDWRISVKHVLREANFLADFLANKGHELMLGRRLITRRVGFCIGFVMTLLGSLELILSLLIINAQLSTNFFQKFGS